MKQYQSARQIHDNNMATCFSCKLKKKKNVLLCKAIRAASHLQIFSFNQLHGRPLLTCFSFLVHAFQPGTLQFTLRPNKLDCTLDSLSHCTAAF